MVYRLVLMVLFTGLTWVAPVYGADSSGGDPARGAELYSRCMGCHSFERNRTGPMHCGLFGRKAGGVAGYNYSKAMKKSDIVWSIGTLNRFLAAPLEFVPGTKMGYAGVKDPKDRADLISYMAATSKDPSVCR